ncbi:DUF4276 family protein [Anabaena sp. FACHB-1250]|uniref:DUF4276 family protein n=1 Tax=unclassified Anabaena TaxID=2619674 RepID=UPI001680051F|nr:MULTISPECIES: DUF4276 family protein [unclassified Anabaena]MBD2142129.1 DUF4276 family protein [Anabaena sp. FACHB-1250]MBD2269611.1 DUF4276 family protein [Anabaena sp. FACHB-1391]
MEIYIYIEGAGNEDDTELIPRQRPGFRSGIISGKETTRSLSPGFYSFFQELYDIAEINDIKIRLIMCGSRVKAYQSFKWGLEDHPEAFNVLLIDSESPVSPDDTPWEHLRNRKEDQPWILDSLSFNDEQCHLMVQTMEAWFVADIDALKNFYGEGFREEKIMHEMAKCENLEQVSKDTLFQWLKAATRNSKQGTYTKQTKRNPIHALEILKRLDANKVRQASPYCNRIFTTIQAIMDVSTNNHN